MTTIRKSMRMIYWSWMKMMIDWYMLRRNWGKNAATEKRNKYIREGEMDVVKLYESRLQRLEVKLLELTSLQERETTCFCYWKGWERLSSTALVRIRSVSWFVLELKREDRSTRCESSSVVMRLHVRRRSMKHRRTIDLLLLRHPGFWVMLMMLT